MIRVIVVALAVFLLVGRASAHIGLLVREAPAGSFYKATFTVPHGCDGSATVQLAVHIPEGVTSVKPQPKPGWEVATVKEGDAVREVSWRGRLDDAFYDEFVVLVHLPPTPDVTLSFPVLQTCERGEARWAPTLRLMPGAEAEHHHH
nr:hypothetical protein [uncultured bacterium]